MELPFRRQFLDEIEAQRATIAVHEIAEMFVGTRLYGCAAELKHVFGCDRRVQMELATRPVRGDADRGVRRKLVPLRVLAEIHVDADGSYKDIPLGALLAPLSGDRSRG